MAAPFSLSLSGFLAGFGHLLIKISGGARSDKSEGSGGGA